MAILGAAAQGWRRKARRLKPALEAPLLPALQVALRAPAQAARLCQKERWGGKRQQEGSQGRA